MRAGDDYDAMAEVYRDHVGNEVEQLPKAREDLDALIAALGAPAADALVADIGCGPGHIGEYVVGQGLRVVGVDLSAKLLAFASDLGLPVARGTIGSLPLHDASVDGVIARHIIIHLEAEELEQACRELLRVLKPGGAAMVSFFVTDNETDPPVFHDHVVSPSWRYSVTQVSETLCASGAEVLSVTSWPPLGRVPSETILLRKR